MDLDASLKRDMLRHAMAAPVSPGGYLEEACGILAGKNGRAVKFFPTENEEHSATRFRVAAKDQIGVQSELFANDWDLLGIFHSHTHTEAYPSGTDRSLAVNWPDAIYLIASLKDGAETLRAFKIVNGTATEEEIRLFDDA